MRLDPDGAVYPGGVTTIVWFRIDLRLADNPALAAAARAGRGPVFIWAPDEEGDWPPGAASRWWLHRSLRALARRSASAAHADHPARPDLEALPRLRARPAPTRSTGTAATSRPPIAARPRC